jgi:hypothetical protein
MSRGGHVDTPTVSLLCLLGIISIPMTFAGIILVF